MELGVAYFQIHWSFDVQVWNDRIFEGPAAVAWPSRGGKTGDSTWYSRSQHNWASKWSLPFFAPPSPWAPASGTQVRAQCLKSIEVRPWSLDGIQWQVEIRPAAFCGSTATRICSASTWTCTWSTGQFRASTWRLTRTLAGDCSGFPSQIGVHWHNWHRGRGIGGIGWMKQSCMGIIPKSGAFLERSWWNWKKRPIGALATWDLGSLLLCTALPKVGELDHAESHEGNILRSYFWNKLRCYPEQLESFCVFAIKKCLCYKN